MKNVSHNKNWNMGVVQLYVDPPLTPLIKSKHDENSDKDFVILKLRRDVMSKNPYLYDFKMDLFNNGNTEESLLFFCNFNMTIDASETLGAAEKV